MPNSIAPVGDDQAWKKEVDRELEKLQRENRELRALIEAMR